MRQVGFRDCWNDREHFGDLGPPARTAVVNHVDPRFGPKYLRLGREWIERTGTTNRIPSTEATQPPPHNRASGTAARALTSTVLAAAMVSERM